MSWFEKFPFVEAFLHIKNNVYPCFRRKCGMVCYFLFLLSFVLLMSIWNKAEQGTIEIVIWWKIFIFYVLLFLLCWVIFYWVTSYFGVTFLGKISSKKYAEYIIANYWKYIEIDANKNFLKNIFNALQKEDNLLQRTLEVEIKTADNFFKKKYLLDAILSVCSKSNSERVIGNILINFISTNENDFFNDYIVEQIHLWNMKNRDLSGLIIYFQILKRIGDNQRLERRVIHNLIVFIGTNNDYKKEINRIQNDSKIDFILPRHVVRIEEYIKSEEAFVQRMNTIYQSKGTYINIKTDPLEDMPL